MFRNYFITAIRNIMKHKLYSIVNISGLAIGFVSFILIALFISDELQYDRYHSKADRIYRACRLIDTNSLDEDAATTSFPFAPALEQDYPDMVDAAVRFFNFQAPQLFVEIGEKRFNEKRFFFADSTVFRVFDYEFIKGNPGHALDRPGTVVMTESMVKKYFGNDNPMGQTLRLEEQGDFEITGVIKDLPDQSHFKFDFLGSLNTVRGIFGGDYPRSWIWNPCWAYVLLKENITPEMLEARMPEFYENHYPDFQDQNVHLYFQPLTDIHLYSHLDYEITANSSIMHIYILAAIAVFILIIASINFMNLTTASSAGRAREIGMKKVFGANKRSLILQFLGESIFMSFIALFIALIIIELLLPYFNDFSGKNLQADFIFDSMHILAMTSLGLFMGLLAGLYPAFFLSAFRPIKVLKGKLTRGTKSGLSRKMLVIAQFTISIVLIIGTLVVFDQLNYMMNADLGFEKEQVIIMPINNNIFRNFDTFMSEVKDIPEVVNATASEYMIGTDHNTHGYVVEGQDPNKPIFYSTMVVRENFLETFGIEVVAGRGYSADYPSDDSLGLLINEAMAGYFGWTNEEAIGKRFRRDGNEVVVGVVKNFKVMSLHNPEERFVLDLPSNPFQEQSFTRYIAARVSTDNYSRVLDALKEKWAKFSPTRPFDYTFLNQELDRLYRFEMKFSQLALGLTVLTIFIAILGLFGLTSFLTEQRTKEIGIRKVLGASIFGIIHLISREFIILITLATVIAIPVAYAIINDWLDNFAYRVGVNPVLFVLAGAIALFVALITVSYQAIKAATANPVDALKYE